MSKPIRRSVLPAAAANSRQVEQELRDRVKSLEVEVKTLKTKLDDLRRAKNTTFIKKEKEFVTTVLPNRQSEHNSRVSESKDDIDLRDAKYQKEIENLRTELEKAKLSPPVEAPVEDCGHAEIIMALQDRLSDVESMNTALTIQNSQLQEKLSQAYNDISQKEAQHCEDQETMKAELQKKWQEMYKEWMRTTEAKITELQAANDMMRRMLSSTRPNP